MFVGEKNKPDVCFYLQIFLRCIFSVFSVTPFLILFLDQVDRKCFLFLSPFLFSLTSHISPETKQNKYKPCCVFFLVNYLKQLCSFFTITYTRLQHHTLPMVLVISHDSQISHVQGFRWILASNQASHQPTNLFKSFINQIYLQQETFVW